MLPWTMLADSWRKGRVRADALVIGNGPSRIERRDVAVRASERAHVIACNAYWREAAKGWWPEPELLVCYDGEQALMATERLYADHDFRILVPEQRDTAVRFEPPAQHDDRIYVAAPHVCAATEPLILASRWTRHGAAAYGNLSGLIAYQAALLCGAERVFLLGVDCGGRLAGDRVELSAVGRHVQGYDHGDAPAEHCTVVGETYLPPQWEATRSLWRALTKRALELGTQTYLAAPGGALDWLEVRVP